MNSYPIGDFIKRRREALGMIQEELGDGICTPATLSRIENGHQIPTPRTVIALLQRIGVSSDVYIS